MKKTWLKTNVVYTMVNKEDGKEAKRSFANLVEDVTEKQVAEFGSILSVLSDASYLSAVVDDKTQHMA
ncbi:DUF1659 domain-containing protein [Apilactobacillus xinyiensis]|uniref:DUF1659 domain-containing protein n=1 Tax=Apilactobacillus xinyiensis TaxID=2841032 RepID=A0ABT0I3A4_9LACO|nr:hypothetical protein [Apilactobacillus xinyiensis]MCK8625181.1 hypothetical protein [Apilactobacillus xinyiensis]MCL0318924.1 hypothetical protein [Apilactobacillus xinyiensis]MCL0330360.1 hypothetical protein [Apilactobacillus xinyiensis]